MAPSNKGLSHTYYLLKQKKALSQRLTIKKYSCVHVNQHSNQPISLAKRKNMVSLIRISTCKISLLLFLKPKLQNWLKLLRMKKF